jgi:hypothetical protein
MAAVGADCPFRFSDGLSCMATGRIDASENSGTGCNHTDTDTGVLCCAN